MPAPLYDMRQCNNVTMLDHDQVSNPLAAICNNDDYNRSTRLLAATTLRNVLGTKVW